MQQKHNSLLFDLPTQKNYMEWTQDTDRVELLVYPCLNIFKQKGTIGCINYDILNSIFTYAYKYMHNHKNTSLYT